MVAWIKQIFDANPLHRHLFVMEVESSGLMHTDMFPAPAAGFLRIRHRLPARSDGEELVFVPRTCSCTPNTFSPPKVNVPDISPHV